MDILFVTLRLLHIVGAVLWVGMSAFMLFFFEPSVRATGAQGQRFMSQLLTGTRFPAVISVAAVVTILAGIVLYLRDSNGFDINWIKSGPGILFTIGAIAGIVAGYFGGSISGPASDRMGKLLGEIGSNPPTTEQQATLASLQARMEMASKWGFVAMVVALVGMGVARYVTF